MSANFRRIKHVFKRIEYMLPLDYIQTFSSLEKSFFTDDWYSLSLLPLYDLFNQRFVGFWLFYSSELDCGIQKRAAAFDDQRHKTFCLGFTFDIESILT
jgi:hypothetical protein